MELMGKDTVLTALRELTGWHYRDDVVAKTFQPGSFRQAVALLNRIAEAAEQQQHHPEMTLRGDGTLAVTLTTHSAGGVTRDDIKLATTIEGIAQQGR